MAENESRKMNKEEKYVMIISVLVVIIIALAMALAFTLGTRTAPSTTTTIQGVVTSKPSTTVAQNLSNITQPQPTVIDPSSVKYLINSSEVTSILGPVSDAIALEINTPEQLNAYVPEQFSGYNINAEYQVYFNSTSDSGGLLQYIVSAQTSGPIYSSILNSTTQISNPSSFSTQVSLYDPNATIKNMTEGLNATIGGMKYSFGSYSVLLQPSNSVITITNLVGVKNTFVVRVQLSQVNVTKGYNVTHLASIVANHLS